MKKILLLLLATFTVFSCEYDDMWIKDEFSSLDDRIENLETFCNELNSQLESLEQIIKALESNEYITDYVRINKNGVSGYKIVFDSGREIVIYNGEDGEDGKDGKDGEDGKDGYVPNISVKQDTDGEWYWTIDGEWMLDEEGNRVSTTGRTDLTPMLKIENMFWHVSYDGGKSWVQMDKAVGEDGHSFFKEITEDENNVYLTLIDGTTITLPKKSQFSLELNISENIPCGPCSTIRIPYTLKGAGDNPQIITMAEGKWNAEVVSTSTTAGHIIITAPEDISEGQVVIIASDQSKTVVKALSFVEGVFISKDEFKLSDEGGELTVELSTNYDYDITIDASWITHLETKTVRSESAVFAYEPLPESISSRSARITFKDRFCDMVYTIEVHQGSLVSLNKQYVLLMTNEEEQLVATSLDDNQKLVWTSSDSNIAWVNQDGKVTAVSKGKATITVMTSDYVHSATCQVEVGNISDYIYLRTGSATNVSYSNGYVHAGSQLSWYFYNNSSSSVTVKYLQIVDDYGTTSNQMTVNTSLAAGESTGWTITLGKSYKAPKCKAVYEYKGKEYSTICGHMFN